MTIYQGKIESFSGSWGSGIGFLLFKNGKVVHCSNTSTVRALDSMFDNVIVDHDVNNEALYNKEVVYGINDFGILSFLAFTHQFYDLQEETQELQNITLGSRELENGIYCEQPE